MERKRNKKLMKDTGNKQEEVKRKNKKRIFKPVRYLRLHFNINFSLVCQRWQEGVTRFTLGYE